MLHRDVAFHRERGAVPLYAVIILVVTTLAGVIVSWMLSQKVTGAEKATETVTTELASARKKFEDTEKKYRDFTAKVGFDAGGPDGSVESAAELVEQAKKALGSDAPVGGKIQDLLLAALKVNADKTALLASKEAEIKQREATIDSAKSETTTIRGDLQKQIDDAKKASEDQKNSDAARIQNLESQIAEKERAAKEATDKQTALTEQLEKATAEWQKTNSLVAAKNADLNQKLSFLRSPAEPKGSMVDVSDALPIGYIDLGQRERVVPGMRFEIVDFDGQRKMRSKGYAEVTSVEPSMSRVRIEATDKIHPIAKGDLLLNPLFDPKGARKAVLIGRFPLSAGGRKGVEQRLKDLGISVSDKVDASTDYLIQGDPEFSNTGEPQDMDSHPEVLSAGKFGTLRYSLKDLSGYFRN
ncbi:MAG: hypothetical protein ACKVS6_11660 [Planctomycetota bacterium]